jgi:hypothetical protein
MMLRFTGDHRVAIYINTAFVVSMRPDTADPEHASIVKLSDEESLPIRGGRIGLCLRGM